MKNILKLVVLVVITSFLFTSCETLWNNQIDNEPLGNDSKILLYENVSEAINDAKTDLTEYKDTRSERFVGDWTYINKDLNSILDSTQTDGLPPDIIFEMTFILQSDYTGTLALKAIGYDEEFVREIKIRWDIDPYPRQTITIVAEEDTSIYFNLDHSNNQFMTMHDYEMGTMYFLRK